MSIRSRIVSTLTDPSMVDQVEHLRRGTRQQYVSAWVSIAGSSATADFTHELGEIPWVVDVIYSETSDGRGPTDASGIVTTAKTDTTVTVTNTDTASHYFQVRAL